MEPRKDQNAEAVPRDEPERFGLLNTPCLGELDVNRLASLAQ